MLSLVQLKSDNTSAVPIYTVMAAEFIWKFQFLVNWDPVMTKDYPLRS